MPTQRLDRIELPRQFHFRQRRVDLVVTDLVQPHDRPALAALQLGHKVMQALPGTGRNGPQAERANRVLGQFVLILSDSAGKRLAQRVKMTRGV